MSKKPPACRTLLRVSTICEGDRDTVITYHLTPKQLARRWDGLSAIRMPFARVTATALSTLHRRGITPAAVKEVKLSCQRFPDASWYYFWEVQVAHAGDEMRYQTTDVLVDIAGQLIEEEVKVFDDPNRRKRSAASEAYAAGLSVG